MLSTFSSYAEEEVNGQMICKVKSNYIVEIDGGKVKTYSSIENSFKKGDELVFNFHLTAGLVSLELNFNDEILFDTNIYTSNTSAKFEEIEGGGFRVDYAPEIKAFRSNWINIDGFNLTNGFSSNNLTLSRYYKSDWNGIYRESIKLGEAEQLATLDCRQNNDKVDEFIKNATFNYLQYEYDKK